MFIDILGFDAQISVLTELSEFQTKRSKLQNCSFDGIFCESMVTHKKKDTIRATFP
jgi:hypothetical protein